MVFAQQYLPRMSGLIDEDDIEICMEHKELTERLRKTLYYGKLPGTDRPSFPLTELAVGYFQDAAPRELGRVDTYIASAYGRKACMSPCSMMLGMLYIERLKKRNPEYLNNISSSDLFLISMMMASKYLYDEGIDEEVFNDEWAESANMDVAQINELEGNFLNAIEWRLFVSPEDFWRMLTRVEQQIAYYKTKDRGFSCYSDLFVLSGGLDMYHSIKLVATEVHRLVLVCSVAYVASVMTMVASTALMVCVQQQLLSIHSSLTVPVSDLSDAPYQNRLQPVPILETAENQLNEDQLEFNVSNVEVDLPEKMLDQRYMDRTAQVGFSGMITLLMVRDTVFGFVNAVRHEVGKMRTETSGSSQIGDENEIERLFPEESDMDRFDIDVDCSCGSCETRNDNCYNLTIGDQWKNEHRCQDNRNSCAHGQNGQRNSQSNLNCIHNLCCCKVWNKNPADSWNVPNLEIEAPFAGTFQQYGTSAMAAVSG